MRRLLAHIDGVHGADGALLYGTGMRLMEGVRLRVKDVEFERREIVVRDGKGGKDRVTMLPRVARSSRCASIWPRARAGPWRDRARGVARRRAARRARPQVSRAPAGAWAWQWVFPARDASIDPRTGIERRHHIYEQTLAARRHARGPHAPASPSRSAATRCAIRSPPTCWKRATTSARCRSCSATRT